MVIIKDKKNISQRILAAEIAARKKKLNEELSAALEAADKINVDRVCSAGQLSLESLSEEQACIFVRAAIKKGDLKGAKLFYREYRCKELTDEIVSSMRD